MSKGRGKGHFQDKIAFPVEGFVRQPAVLRVVPFSGPEGWNRERS